MGPVGEAERSSLSEGTCARAITYMVSSIRCGDLPQSEDIHTIKARDVVAINHGIGSPSVMRVDPAYPAEVVFGHHGVELIESDVLFALKYVKLTYRDRR